MNSPHQSHYSDPEISNPEDFEFDESQETGASIDGMGFLTLEPSKAGYTGPQSGIAALKLLRSMPAAHLVEIGDENPLLLDTGDLTPDVSRLWQRPDQATLVDDYFRFYHPAYPLLHEGSFRARASGAIAKPKDGSWPLLYNMVLAMGAFAGDTHGGDSDLPYFRAASESVTLSVIEKGSLCYVQGLMLMANYLQKRGNKPNAGFALIGIAWSMALAIGLHREFGPYGTTPFSMELRRRTWWTLFIFVSGAQLTLGRPPASLTGINVRCPVNVDDDQLVVDMDALPQEQEVPTATSCLIAQIPFAEITNTVQSELLNNPFPDAAVVKELDGRIETWRANLPPYFHAEAQFKWSFELSRRVLLWRSHHLLIVLNRPFLFQAVSTGSVLSTAGEPVRRCIHTADVCADSICGFLAANSNYPRGFAWYATYWLISASFIHAICFAYAPTDPAAESWKSKVEQSITALESLGFAHCMAEKACKMLQRFYSAYCITQRTYHECIDPADRCTAPISAQQSTSEALPRFMAENFGLIGDGQANDINWMNHQWGLHGPSTVPNDASMSWSWPRSLNAEFLDAAGANLFHEYQDGFSAL
ncbi:hypothetical protein KC331_g849 [Hortaea werneckii]|nr:hypothetical protein KC331_g849 [Hortaea werneckii]KAI7722340.1 hypothetical protein KC353_g584 [Hortaea werneckii]